MDTPYREVAGIAEPQHGVVARPQVVAAGASDWQIRNSFARGRWEDLGEDVIRIPGSQRTWRQRVCVGTLAGPGGAASGRTAAALFHIPGFAENRVEIVRPMTASAISNLAVVHRSRWLPPWHLTVVDGIRTTTVARTLFDLAALVSFPRLRRAVNNALAMRLVTYEQLDAMLQELALRGRSGIRPMRKVLSRLGPGKMPTESELEDAFLDLLEANDEPLPERQVNVGTATEWVGRADFRDLGTPVLFEIDGRTHHQQELDRESDAVRDAELAASGFALLRIPSSRLKEDPDWVLEKVRELRRRHSVYARRGVPGATNTRNASLGVRRRWPGPA
jgi:hypothetical protein